MKSLRSWVVALAVVGAVGMNPVALEAQPGKPVQGELELVIQDLDGCAEGVLYSVAPGKRLQIEWVSVETFEFFATDYTPVLVDITTWLGGQEVTHSLTRVESANICAICFFGRGSVSEEVTLYSQQNRDVTVRACRDNDSDETGVTVTFAGRLFP